MTEWDAPWRTAQASARRRLPPAGMSAVEQLLAYEQIRQLASRYALAVNLRDLDALVELFVEDVRAGRDGRGRDELKDVFRSHMRAAGVDVLQVTTHVIDLLDAEHATGTVYSRCDMGDIHEWGHQLIAYEDVYERRDGLWYFVSRDHLLFYGVIQSEASPLDQEPAHWPRRTVGRGSVPYDWPSWQAFRQAAGPVE